MKGGCSNAAAFFHGAPGIAQYPLKGSCMGSEQVAIEAFPDRHATNFHAEFRPAIQLCRQLINCWDNS
jgi:hypothetical protein